MILSELKTKYPSLDEGNISSFIGDIRRAVEGDEISNTDVRNYLDSLVDGFEPEGQRICALREPSAPDKAALTVAGRVLAAEMLLLRKMNSLGALRHRSLMFLQYCAALSRTNYPFVETMLAVACYQIDSPGFHWNDIQIALSLDQLAYRFIHDGHIIKDKSESWLLRGRGSVSLKDGRLTLSSFAGTEAGAEAFKTGGDRVSVVSRNVRDEKLKSSESNDAEAVARFAKSFLSELDRSPVSRAARPAPVAGDEVDIVCVGQNDDARLVFRILDDDHPFEGVLEEEELVVGLKTSELEDFIFQDDCIKGAVLLGDGPEHSFSIRSAYQEFAVSAAKDAYHAGTCFEARVSHLRNDIKCLNWISALGFGGVSNLPEGSSLKEGDVRVLEMKMLPNTGKSVYINVRTPRAAVDKIVRLDEDEVLRGFVRTQAAILASQEEERKQDAAKDVTPKVLGRIASALASRAPLQPPMDRYRMLLSAQFLFRILDDGDRVRALQTEASWLQRCLCFA